MSKFYITNAIPYVNAKPHIGHSLEFCQSDAIARYHRLIGDDTMFMMGADENSLKNVQAAEKAGEKTTDFVSKLTQIFLDLNKELNISNDEFIKTSTLEHFKGAEKFWGDCDKNGDIYKKSYQGLYCVGCEEFKRESDLILGEIREGEKVGYGCCPEHPNSELQLIEEENYFFKLSRYQKDLEKLIKSGRIKIVPESRKNEVLSFIKMGLEDFSISRSVERAKGWGVPVPGDDSQVMYVWFDALVNYITGLGYGEDSEFFKKFWLENKNILHVIGKGIIKFHAIYWPAMLMSVGIMPENLEILAHGYITVNGQKISKSLGNVIDPIEIINKYGTDATRYYLLRAIPTTGDGDFSFPHFEEIYNADLANGIGNLVSRVLAMSNKYFGGKVSKIQNDPSSHPLKGAPSLNAWKESCDEMKKSFELYKLNDALFFINQFIQSVNIYIDNRKPWVLAKEGKVEEMAWVLYGLLESIRQLSWMIYPFIPETANKIREQLGVEKIDENNFDFYNEIKWGGLKTGTKIGKIEALFPRIEN